MGKTLSLFISSWIATLLFVPFCLASEAKPAPAKSEKKSRIISSTQSTKEFSCEDVAAKAIMSTVRAMGITQEIGFDFREPVVSGKDTSLYEYSTLGVLRVEEGYLSDSSAIVHVLKSSRGCKVKKIQVQVGRLD